MKLLAILLILIVSNLIGGHVPVKTRSIDIGSKCGLSVNERLTNHFDGFEIRPDLVFNNKDHDLGLVRSKTRTIAVANHRISWITTVSKNDVRSAIRIDNETIQLKGQLSINNADGDAKIEMDLVNDWDQIKFYKLADREIIGISLSPSNCTGLMCSVSAQLLYDLSSRKKSFFGAYQTDREVKLYRYGSDDTPFFVGRSFEGDPHGLTSPIVVTSELYRLRPDGQFEIQHDIAGKKYFIKQTVFPDREFAGQEVKLKKELLPDTMEQHWIRAIE